MMWGIKVLYLVLIVIMVIWIKQRVEISTKVYDDIHLEIDKIERELDKIENKMDDIEKVFDEIEREIDEELYR